ncbi:PEP-CTERM sorting domain-containing protein [uncultured Desulfobacter sp.]|uniref:PEP-CTERM sorting domain-containing protein n=1 Tax=uncultured Desulfobacter sp. TaxID=240139 RepID=UPI002AAC3A6E|nr:PEP-CTERM sorting domain-containing protein [uncultured Desulfobacter sp.]
MKNLSRILLITLFLFGITTNAFATAPLPPVPEPATAMLFGLGVLAIAGISRRKK